MGDMMMDCPRCWGKKCDLCKQTGKMPDRYLSPHFKLSEMLNTQIGRKNGLANDPTPEIEANLERLCKEALEPIRELCGAIKVNSGYRSDAVNKAVGGSTTSAHSYGLAADLHPLKVTWKQLMDKTIASGLKLDQIIFEHTWVHVGLLHPKNKKQRGERLTMFQRDGKTVYETYNPDDERIA
jgi:zinc D-Ala-D-Ala carboxypeptidase